MRRDGQHVVAGIEDVLRAVAVVRVDVQHRDAREGGAQALRGDGAVVDVAEAVRPIAVGVMSGRPAQRIGRVARRDHGVGRGDRRVRRADDRRPAVRAERAGEVADVPAGARDQRRGGAGRPCDAGDAAVVRGEVRQHLDAGLDPGRHPHRTPLNVGLLQVVEVVDAVDRLERPASVVRRYLERDADRGQPVLQRVRAARQVGRLRDPSEPHELLRVVQQLVVGEEGPHRAQRPSLASATISTSPRSDRSPGRSGRTARRSRHRS